ncbi:MAG: hypothetical protein ABIB97_00040 [Patescibacteria group bacterium]
MEDQPAEDKKPHCEICHVDFETDEELAKHKEEAHGPEGSM